MKTDYDDVARVAVEMAKEIDKVRPDIIIAPLRSGCVTSKIVMEALRSNLGVPVSEYDPPIMPVSLKFQNGVEAGRSQLSRLEELRTSEKFKEVYPSTEKIMIIDFTNSGESPGYYLTKNLYLFSKLGKKVYVNLMAANQKNYQELELRGLLDRRNFKFKFSRIKEEHIPFDDNDVKIGLECKFQGSRVNFEPTGFLESSSYLNKCRNSSQEFYMRMEKALDKRMRKDERYRSKHHLKKEEPTIVVSELLEKAIN